MCARIVKRGESINEIKSPMGINIKLKICICMSSRYIQEHPRLLMQREVQMHAADRCAHIDK